MATDQPTKICAHCKIEQPVSLFGRAPKRTDGLRPWCRTCRKIEKREDRQRNKEKRQAWDQAYYQHNKAIYRARGKEWARAHPEEMAGYSRRWIERNPEKRKAVEAASEKKRDRKARAVWRREWWSKNSERLTALNRARRKARPEAFAIFDRNKRAKRRLAKGTHAPEDIADIRRLQGGLCAMPFCREALADNDETVDHIVALVKGGTNDRKNVQLLCRRCNCRKRDKDQIDFLRENGFLI
jgi:5-methylcytosine-specific restriction endonuclease McrA